MFDFTKEFPDFPVTDMPALPTDCGFVDTSWHNNSCPSFTSDQIGLTVWIDYLDTSSRAFEHHYPRFRVERQEHGVEVSGEWLDTDDWNAVLAFIAKRRQHILECIKRDADAKLAGFTREVYAECDFTDGVYLIRPDADLDDVVRAWCTDTNRLVRLNGWLWTFEEVD